LEAIYGEVEMSSAAVVLSVTMPLLASTTGTLTIAAITSSASIGTVYLPVLGDVGGNVNIGGEPMHKGMLHQITLATEG
jgi:hypothetical protein